MAKKFEAQVVELKKGITGSVHVKGGTIDVTGSVGISELPGVTGSVGIKEIPSISGSVGVKEIPSITGSIDIRGGTINITGSVGIKQLPGVTGSVGVKNIATDYLKQGGYLGSVGHLTSGTVGIEEMPAVTGSVGIKEMPGVSGSVGIKQLPGITGSVGVKQLPSIAGSVRIKSGSINVKYAGVSYTPIRKNENITKTVTGTPVWTPAAGKAINLTDEILSAKDAMPVSFGLEGTLGPYYFAANGGLTTNLKTQLQGSPGGKLSVTTTGTATVTFIGYEE